ncbi:uncharacterized protein LOC126679474 [Mercurialis annua]|uniref:uncharacterized protein LOC126679474 n=1 Tax=Mercurialis annua TaxID=3986 RepID=UPI00215E9B29|nr:uncharacterized protein LOC126679474 [Mercurialis annua]
MNPNPSSNPPPPQTTDAYYPSNYSYYVQPTAAAPEEPRPPGVDSYQPPLQQQQQQGHALSYAPLDTSASAYYLDPNLQNWDAKEAVRQYGFDPAAYGAALNVMVPQDGMQQLAIAQPGLTLLPNFTFQTQGNGTLKKLKKTKVVQSAHCEVCKVDCNSNEVLDQHKLGKKHKNNLEKLRVAAILSSASVEIQNPLIGPQPNPEKSKTGSGQKNKKKAAALEDLETKRRKIVEGGAAQEAVRVCAVCNVVCNSESVYNYHLAGRKHALMLKKQGITVAAAI